MEFGETSKPGFRNTWLDQEESHPGADPIEFEKPQNRATPSFLSRAVFNFRIRWMALGSFLNSVVRDQA